MEPIVAIDDPNFIDKMDNWYKSTSYRKYWDDKIPTYLSYFVYWCSKTKLNVDVNSTKYDGRYYYATEKFEKYMATINNKSIITQDFQYGYPLSISNKNNRVIIYQKTFNEVLFYEVPQNNLTAIEFTEYFNKNIYFKFNDDDIEYYPGDDFFVNAIEREINQLFLVDPVPYGSK
jgi:hypothetical protein